VTIEILAWVESTPRFRNRVNKNISYSNKNIKVRYKNFDKKMFDVILSNVSFTVLEDMWFNVIIVGYIMLNTISGSYSML